MNTRIKSECMLVIVTMLWGLTFPLIHTAVAYIDGAEFVFWRFLIAAIFLIPFVVGVLYKTNRYILIASLILGVLNAATFICQSIGLQTISSPRSAFITGSSVIMVPLLAPLFKLGMPKTIDAACVILCLIGLYILTGLQFDHFSIGDLWTAGCAFFAALEILITQIISNQTQSYRLITFYQVLFTLPLALGTGLPIHWHILSNPRVLWPIIICGILCTVLVFYLRLKYQQGTTAHRSALIFLLEPVFAVIFAYLINGTAITAPIVLGGLLMIVAIGLPDLIATLKRT